MATLDLDEGIFVEDVKPLIFVMSDARGETANVVVMAAAAQFGPDSVDIVRLHDARDLQKVSAFLDENVQPNRPMAVFHTFSDRNMRREVRGLLEERGIPSIDLLGPAISVIATLSGEEPNNRVGALRDQLGK
ncbi:MAG: kinase/pyrophosphorylase [Atopobiaceae bacterium]|jgi:regulator of PEP synthase PpsR (kinase-PPPase family)